MATVHFIAGIEPVAADNDANLGSGCKSCPPLFRFGLRQLLLAFAALSSLFAALSVAQGLAALALLLAIIVVAMHVFATALGTRLRAQSDADHVFEASSSAVERSARMAAISAQARSPWHARGTTALPWLRVLVFLAIGIGGIAGSAYLAATIGYRTSPAGVVVGGFSVAVLCGWFAFLFGSFYGVFRHGFREAAADEK
jgi:hypothetical protein